LAAGSRADSAAAVVGTIERAILGTRRRRSLSAMAVSSTRAAQSATVALPVVAVAWGLVLSRSLQTLTRPRHRRLGGRWTNSCVGCARNLLRIATSPGPRVSQAAAVVLLVVLVVLVVLLVVVALLVLLVLLVLLL
jgi:hypothetical protein